MTLVPAPGEVPEEEKKEDGSIEVVESVVEGTFIHVCFHLKDVDECFDREELEKLFE